MSVSVKIINDLTDMSLLEKIAARLTHYGLIEFKLDGLVKIVESSDITLLGLYDDRELIGALFGMVNGDAFNIVESYIELFVYHDRPKFNEVFRVCRDWIRERGYKRCFIEGCARQLEAIRVCQDNGVKILGYKSAHEHPNKVPTVKMEVPL
jgi:hypothetical protein